jgi:hypothetical protein
MVFIVVVFRRNDTRATRVPLDQYFCSTVHWSVVKRLWADETEHAEVGVFKADENGGQVDQVVVECLREYDHVVDVDNRAVMCSPLSTESLQRAQTPGAFLSL